MCDSQREVNSNYICLKCRDRQERHVTFRILKIPAVISIEQFSLSDVFSVMMSSTQKLSKTEKF